MPITQSATNPAINSVTSLQRLAIVLLLLFSSACQVPEPPVDNRYQRAPENTAYSGQSPSGPVVQLQNQALAAINEDQYQLAIDYLQRAIKIQPRDPWSWHYLADIYWRKGQYDRCLAMIDRSSGYAVNDAAIADANAELRAQC